MRISIACDHGGLPLKAPIEQYLTSQGIEFVDYGVNEPVSVDYPDYAAPVARDVQSGASQKGILLCGTGIGITIAANKFKGIRAAVVSDEFCAAMCAEHNNANILGLGGRVVSPEKAVKLVDIWLHTPFAGGRHQNRIDKIAALEDSQNK